MPTQKYQLTWMTATHRWRKKFRGKIYYFAARKTETMKTSYQRCLAQWEAKRKQLIAEEPKETPEQRTYKDAIEKWRQVRKWHAKGLDGDLSKKGYDRADAMIAELQQRLKKGDSTPLNNFERDPLYGISQAGQWVWMDRQKQMEVNGTKIDGTIAAIADHFLQGKREQVKAGERTAGRYDSIRCHLEQFRDWAGGHRPVADLTYDLLEGYHKHLLTLTCKDISKSTARDRMQTTKQLAIYAARKKLIPPIMVSAQDFSFRLPAPKIKTATFADIRNLLDSSSDRTKLYLLLMVNTGMTQKDISDLQQDQVNWDKGRIKRKRSKTQHKKGVPEVDYPLWSETFELLKEHRSSDTTRALVNQKGGPLYEQVIKDNGKAKKNDNINSAFVRVARKLKLTHITLKQLRATSATILNKHQNYHRLAQHFLGQSPTTIAERHYVVQSQELFDKAIKWLGKQYGIK